MTDRFWEGIAIDAESWVPAYYQLEEAFRSRLTGGQLAAGTRLPPERQIAIRLGVSRMTVRRALHGLERDGLLVRRQGDGTYVGQPRLEAGVGFLSGFTAELAGRVQRMTTRVLDLAAVRPDATLRDILGVEDGPESVIRLRRVRFLDDVPTTLETSWLPASTCKPILGLNLTDQSLYAVLREVAGVCPRRAAERLTAIVLEEFEAGQLDCPAGSPALLVERTSYDGLDAAMEHVRTLLRADRVALTAQIEVADAPGCTR